MKTTKNYVKVDSRNRITIPKALTENLPSVFKIYTENGSIILEPVQEVPKEERWLLDPKNKEIVQALKKALKQKADININLDDLEK
jgi:bifunctional DNA-binding transcriptional regulator/antitoxin component of YhaV-PrlF toxin-antitoxin module